MNIEKNGRYIRISIQPGGYYSTGEPAMITTLLGSCIAACLYDPEVKIIGMNHFMLSNTRYSQDLPIYATEAGKYGIHAMELLINDMLSKGARKNRMRAKVFGGASIMINREKVGNFACVGSVNCKFIREFLNSEGIPIVAENLGGTSGRVIHFMNGDFSIYMRRIDHTRSERLATRDRECWQRAIEMQEKTMPSIELW
ncbi:MAG TPA: chemotaxis protein CheD [Deltaproteobacteria bacterium]|nr:chemotaxis protein CheD [Deltaproteobacteria bacterium]HQB38379.1 chemotaxis protein CheD [Deltaproteobacteria bacterium]